MTYEEREPLVETTRQLVKHPSVNPGGTEAAVVQYLREWFAASSVTFEVTTDEVLENRPNIVARAGDPSKGSLLLTGHTDVVPADPSQWTGDPFILREEGDRLVGRGVADMKGAIAAQMHAAETYIKRTDTPGEVILAFVVNEEQGGSGTRRLLDTGITADCAVIGEPTELDVCTAQYGCARYRLHIRGRSAHAGRPSLGENPIQGVPALLRALANLDETMDCHQHPLLGTGSITPTELHAGIAHNVVPDKLTLTLDWRHPPGIDKPAEWFDDVLTAALAESAPDIDIDLERYDFYPAVETNRDHPVVNVVRAAARNAGLQSEIAGFPAGSDARFLVPDGNIPTVLFGPGSIAQDAHTVDESIAAQDLERAAATYFGALRSYLG